MATTVSTVDYRALYVPMIDRLVRLGGSLSPDQWLAPSLCDKWRVCDVYGHMTYGGITPLPKMLAVLLFKYRGNLNRGSGVESVRYANAHSQPDVISEFRRSAEHPVGIGKLIKPPELHMDHIVHELDVRRPLGLKSEWGDNDLRAALDAAVITKNPLISPANVAKGLRFAATDLAWSHGSSNAQRIEGPAEDLLLAMCGRQIGLTTLHGDGVPELAARISR